MKLRLAGVVVVLFVAACGGSAQAPPSAASPAASPPKERAEPAASGAPLPTTSPDAQPGVADRARDTVSGGAADRMHARADFDEASHQLDASMNECAAACRALASMERATAHLCDIAEHGENDDDRPTCDDARKKLHAARDRVRRACSSCPAGPTLDPSAPP